MRAHGIAPNAASIKPASARATKTERRDSADRPASSKKRKAEAFIEDTTPTDDDEGFSTAPVIKSDPVTCNRSSEQLRVKEEEAAHQLSLGDAANLMQYYDTPSYDGAQLGTEDAYGEYDDVAANGGYTASLFGLHAPQYEMYGGADFDVVPRSLNQGLHYQHQLPMHYSPQSDNQAHQGGSESPVIVE